MTFLPFTLTIYTLITHRNCKEAIQRENPQIGFLQHTHPSFKETATHPQREIILASFPSLSHCHTLREDLYPNTTHTFSKCRECFGAWEILGICQKKPMRLGRCNWAYCGIWKARQDTIPRSLVGVGAWRAQVHWVNQAWRVSCYSCIPTYCLVD